MPSTKKTLLLHQCCGPCSCYPIQNLKLQDEYKVEGFFYNPNIHPMKELYNRLEATLQLNKIENVNSHWDEEYGLKKFLKLSKIPKERRCRTCYAMRLQKTAQKAKKMGVDAFSSSLLYSKHQYHHIIVEEAEKAAKRFGIPFVYSDFRSGHKEGIDISKEYGLYRQQYCGCIYSEEERYETQLPRNLDRYTAKEGIVNHHTADSTDEGCDEGSN